jgi:cephalosporin hydroxylase
MFSGSHDLSNRDVRRDWSASTVKTKHFDVKDQPVEAMQNPWELSQMIELYCDRRPRRVLELGTCLGGVLYHFLKNAIPVAIVGGVDDLSNGGGIVGLDQLEIASDMLDDWESWTPKGVDFQFFNGKTSDPKIVSDVKAKFGSIDFLFIDAGHSYEECLFDFETYGSMVAIGGIICLHDIAQADLGPHRLWREIREAGYVTKQLIADPNATEAGIGVVYI